MPTVNADSQKELETKVKGLVSNFVEEVAINYQRFLREEAPVDTGHLRNSIKILNQHEGQVTIGIPEYGFILQNADQIKPFYPPIEPLKGWAKRKLGAEEAAYAVQQKIGTEGLDENRWITRAKRRLKDKYGGA